MSYMWGITTERPTRAEARRRREAAKAEGATYVEVNYHRLKSVASCAPQVATPIAHGGSCFDDRSRRPLRCGGGPVSTGALRL